MNTAKITVRSSIVALLVAAPLAACARGETRSTTTASTTTTMQSSGSVAQNNADPNGCPNAPLYFESGSAELNSYAQTQLDSLARCLLNAQATEITVIGRADPRGTEEGNRVLSQQRAQNVAQYLRGRGVTSADIVVQGWGEQGQTNNQALYSYERNTEVQLRARRVQQ